MSDKITQERLVPAVPEVGEELCICHIPGLSHAPTERNRCVARTDNQVADEAAGARQPRTGTRRVFYPSTESVAVGTFPPADQALTDTDEARMSTK